MITPRKNEVAAVTEILESDQFDGPESMAKAIVKALVPELDKRDKFVVGLGFNEPPWIPVGPFYGQAEAKDFMEAMAARGWTQAGLTLWGPAKYLEDHEEPDPNAPCADCGHHRSIHHTGKAERTDVKGCGFPIVAKGSKVAKKACPCSKWRQAA